MKPLLTALTAILLLSHTSSAIGDHRLDAERSIRDAADAVTDDRGRDCRRVALRDLEEAEEAVRKARSASELATVSKWLLGLVRDAGEVCERPTVRDIRRAQRDTERYAEALKASAKEETRGPVAMSAADFAQLVKAVRAASFSDDKVQVIAAALAHNHADTGQLVELLALLSFDDDRLSVVGTVASAIVDRKTKGFQVAKAFSFSDSGKKAVAILTR